MERSTIVYFDSPGEKNTDGVFDAVVGRLERKDIEYVVVASDSGTTGMKAVERLRGTGAKLVVVTEHCGSEKEGENTMSPEIERHLVDAGARVVRATHALSGVERSFSRKLGSSSRVEAVAETLRALFGQGMKVAVEVTIMAADSGSIPCGDVKVVAVGGTEKGADTAIVARPAHSNGFFSFRVHEVLAMPHRR